MTPTRPILRYHGGKWLLAPWILSHFPAHRVYTEPFGGGASVLLRKPRSHAEVYNDIDNEIVNLFRVLRDQGDKLVETLRLTPFARAEFELSYADTDDPIEKARRTVVRSHMGFSSASISQATGFRANSNRSGTTPAHDWRHLAEALPLIVDRLRGVIIESRDATEIIKQHDSATTLHYIDPPYVHATRSQTGKTLAAPYRYEMTDDDHVRLAETLNKVKGMVIVSGYPCDLYKEIYKGWEVVYRDAYADGAKSRVEALWLSPSTTSARQSRLNMEVA